MLSYIYFKTLNVHLLFRDLPQSFPVSPHNFRQKPMVRELNRKKTFLHQLKRVAFLWTEIEKQESLSVWLIEKL